MPISTQLQSGVAAVSSDLRCRLLPEKHRSAGADGRSAVACARIRAILHPAVLLVLADGAGFPRLEIVSFSLMKLHPLEEEKHRVRQRAKPNVVGAVTDFLVKAVSIPIYMHLVVRWRWCVSMAGEIEQ